MRSMMLALVFLTGCACCKKRDECPPVLPNGSIIYPPIKTSEYQPQIIQPPLPPAGPPIPANPPIQEQPQTNRVKVLEVIPVHIFPPLPVEFPPPNVEIPEWIEPKIIFPKDGNPVIRTKVHKNFKVIITENPPYNGPPNVGWEICWAW